MTLYIENGNLSSTVVNSYPSPHQNVSQGYAPAPQHPMAQHGRGHEELSRQQSNDLRYQGLLREDMLRHSQQGRMDDQRLLTIVNGNMGPDMARYPSTNNIKSPAPDMHQDMMRQANELIRGEMRPSKSEDMLRQPTRDEMLRYNSTNNIRTQDDPSNNSKQQQQQHMEDVRQSNIGRTEDILKQNEIVRQHPVNASLRGQAKMAEMGEEVRRRQNRVSGGFNQYPQNNGNYQQFQPPNPNSPYYQQQQQQYYNAGQQQQQQQQQYQQPMSPSYTQSSNAYNQPTSTASASSQNYRTYPNNQQAAMAQTQAAMQNLSLNLSPSYATAYNNTSANNGTSGSQLSPQSSAYPKSPPTAPKPKHKLDEVAPPELPPTATHPLYSASMQEPPKGAFYPNPSVPGKVGPANPWEREEREKEMEARRAQARQWRDQQLRELSALSQRTPQQEEQLRSLRLEREFERRAQEAEQEDEDGEKVSYDSSLGLK